MSAEAAAETMKHNPIKVIKFGLENDFKNETIGTDCCFTPSTRGKGLQDDSKTDLKYTVKGRTNRLPNSGNSSNSSTVPRKCKRNDVGLFLYLKYRAFNKMPLAY